MPSISIYTVSDVRALVFPQAEQFLVNANRAISKAELRINRAIAVRVGVSWYSW